jgi:hypothetical protein
MHSTTMPSDDIDPENGVHPLLLSPDTPGDDHNDEEDQQLESPPAAATSAPAVRVVIGSNHAECEWIGAVIATVVIFFVGMKVVFAIHFPIGIGYILVLHRKMDQKERFRNHWMIQWIDKKDYQCIVYLIVLLCIYSIDHRTHGEIQNWWSALFGSEYENPNWFYPWNVILMLTTISFMVLSSASVILMASRKIFVTHRSARTMQPGRERTLVVGKGGAIVSLSVLLFVLSVRKVEAGEYYGPPLGGFFFATCEACLFASTIAAIFKGVNYLRSQDQSSSSSLDGGEGTPTSLFAPREIPE